MAAQVLSISEGQSSGAGEGLMIVYRISVFCHDSEEGASNILPWMSMFALHKQSPSVVFSSAAETEKENDFEEPDTTPDYDYPPTFDYTFFSKSFQVPDQQDRLQCSEGFESFDTMPFRATYAHICFYFKQNSAAADFL